MTNDAVELSFFSNAILRRWYLPVGLAFLGLAVGFVLRPAPSELNEAQTKVLIRPVTDGVLNSDFRVDQLINEDTEAEIAGSDLVAQNAIEALGAEAPIGIGIDDIDDNLSVNVRTDSQIVVFRYTDENPDVAAALVDGIANAYLAARSNAALAERDRQAAVLAQAMADNTRDLTQANLVIDTADREATDRAELEKRIATLEEEVAVAQLSGDDNTPTGDPISPLIAELAALPDTVSAAQLASARTSQSLIGGQIADLRQALVALSTLEIDPGVVLEAARPGSPVTSNAGPLLMAIAGLTGLLLGFVLAVAFERSAAIRSATTPGGSPYADPAPGAGPPPEGFQRQPGETIHLTPTPQFTFEESPPAPTSPPPPVPTPDMAMAGTAAAPPYAVPEQAPQTEQVGFIDAVATTPITEFEP
ncbi:MAG: hypothetical protein GY708_20880, partial [Actinomycetia bacterium]|nr:hypothetical protein [Actinomycetes bacterium]